MSTTPQSLMSRWLGQQIMEVLKGTSTENKFLTKIIWYCEFVLFNCYVGKPFVNSCQIRGRTVRGKPCAAVTVPGSACLILVYLHSNSAQTHPQIHHTKSPCSDTWPGDTALHKNMHSMPSSHGDTLTEPWERGSKTAAEAALPDQHRSQTGARS